ncbi:hypothetical protein [Variovorax sp. CCNWLW235]|uniref:hypothetical protein n=1 Tax=Variovorax sp. CCNWLW235 TaxID=3127463 RepID=UPI0030779380
MGCEAALIAPAQIVENAAMSSAPIPAPASAPLGMPFTRLYLQPAAPLSDSAPFRIRLGSYAQEHLKAEHGDLATFLRVEGGLKLSHTGYWRYDQFFETAALPDILNAITFVYRYLMGKHATRLRFVNVSPFEDMAVAWRQFVHRVLSEQSIGYIVDALCGVHFQVDAEFQRNQASVLRGLGHPRYAAVKAALENALGHLDAQPVDSKSAVRSAFEAMEILARLMVPQAQNLNRRMIDTHLKPQMVAGVIEPTDLAMMGKMLDGFADFVDSIHHYRHGQGVQQPIAPSMDVAVYVLSSAASAVRWLVSVDAKANGIT